MVGDARAGLTGLLTLSISRGRLGALEKLFKFSQEVFNLFHVADFSGGLPEPPAPCRHAAVRAVPRTYSAAQYGTWGAVEQLVGWLRLAIPTEQLSEAAEESSGAGVTIPAGPRTPSRASLRTIPGKPASPALNLVANTSRRSSDAISTGAEGGRPRWTRLGT
jgi:hypothetical protein